MRGGHREGAGRKPGSHNPMAMFYIRVPESTKEALATVEPDRIRAVLALLGEQNGRSSDSKNIH
jgi:hypothetical protein